MKKIISILFILAFCQSVYALDFYGNKSNIDWHVHESKDFRFYYPQKNQAFAEQAIPFVEVVFDSITSRYRIKPDHKVSFVFRHALYSNGFALPSSNSVNVWDTDWGIKLRSVHNWMSDVVTHEFSHVISIRAASKFNPFIHGIFVSYNDYYNEPVKSDLSTAFPLTIFPIWFAEGTAQYESARLGFDAWDSRRDMILRVASIEDDLMDLDDINAFMSDDPFDGEKGPYGQGLSMVKFIADEFGDDKIPRIWSELSRLHRVTLSGALEEVIGVSDRKLYDLWKADVNQRYAEFKDSLGPVVEGKKLTAKGYYHDHLRFYDNKLYGLSNFGAKSFNGKLFALPLLADSLDINKKARPDTSGHWTLSKFADSVNFELEKSYLEKAYDIGTREGIGPSIVYVSYRDRDSDGFPYFDLFIDDTTDVPFKGERKNTVRLTKRLNAIHPNFSPDAKEVVFVRREKSGYRFILSKVIVPEPGEGVPDPIDLVVPIKGQSILNIYNPQYSPDGKVILFSYYDGVSKNIATINNDGTSFKVLVKNGFENGDAIWTPDGSSIIYSSDVSGVFNLYKLDLETNSYYSITNVLGGAFTPAIVFDKKDSLKYSIAYTQYDKDGFSLYHLDNIKQVVLTTVHPEKIKPQIESPESISLSDNKFKGIPSVFNAAPIISFQETASSTKNADKGIVTPMAGVAFGLSDPLSKNFFQLSLLLELGDGFNYITQDGFNPDKQYEFALAWMNQSTPIDISLGFYQRNTNSTDTVSYEDARSHDESFGLSNYAIKTSSVAGSAGYSIFKKGDSISVDAGYNWSKFNLFEDNFEWIYHKQFHLGTRLSYTKGNGMFASNINGTGYGVIGSYQYSHNNLYRPGSFSESFTVVNGVIKPIYRDFDLHNVSGAIWGGLNNPIHPGARIVGSLQSSQLLNWKVSNSSEDTLDFFFHNRLNIDGYPVLADEENLLLHGEKTLLAQLHYIFPIYKNMPYSLWIFNPHSCYVDLFGQIGQVWNDEYPFEEIKENGIDSFYRSVGIEFRFKNYIFYRQEMSIYLRLAKALDDARLNDGSLYEIEPLSWKLFPDAITPTRIYFGISMGFDNPALD